jgi:hypothetical protein
MGGSVASRAADIAIHLILDNNSSPRYFVEQRSGSFKFDLCARPGIIARTSTQIVQGVQY